MAATAKTKQDVQNQSSRERVWDELEAKYSQERAESDKAYDQNKAAFNRGLIATGKQRSSYGSQIAANYDKEKINAQNKSYENQIAAYQSALNTIEQQEADERYRQQQLALQQAQLDQQQAQLEFNKEQALWNQNFQQGQADLAQKNTIWSQAFQEKQADLSQKNTEWSQNYQQKSDDQKIAYNYVMSMLEKGQRPSDDLLARAGLSTADVNTIIGETASSNSPVITWRQAADAAAKKAGYTGRYDPQIEEDRKKAAAGNSTGSKDGIAGAISAAYSSLTSGDNKKKKTTGVMGSAAFD